MKESDVDIKQAWPQGTWFQKRLKAVRDRQLNIQRRHASPQNQMPEDTERPSGHDEPDNR